MLEEVRGLNVLKEKDFGVWRSKDGILGCLSFYFSRVFFRAGGGVLFCGFEGLG